MHVVSGYNQNDKIYDSCVRMCWVKRHQYLLKCKGCSHVGDNNEFRIFRILESFWQRPLQALTSCTKHIQIWSSPNTKICRNYSIPPEKWTCPPKKLTIVKRICILPTIDFSIKHVSFRGCLGPSNPARFWSLETETLETGDFESYQHRLKHVGRWQVITTKKTFIIDITASKHMHIYILKYKYIFVYKYILNIYIAKDIQYNDLRWYIYIYIQ